MSFIYFSLLMMNSVAIPILVRSNFSEYSMDPELAAIFSNGANTDFGDAWYLQFSTLLLVNTGILAVTPLAHALLSFVWLRASRFAKRNFIYANHSNNGTDNVKYLELNAGPEYLFETKTAPLNAVLFTTLIFGLAFPLLYFVGLIAILVQYINERFTLALLYRLPKKYSLSLTLQNVNILAIAPVVASAIAFWMMGNRQLFGHQIGVLETKNDAQPSNHTLDTEAEKIISGQLTVLENIYLIAVIVTLFVFSLFGVTHIYELVMTEPTMGQH